MYRTVSGTALVMGLLASPAWAQDEHIEFEGRTWTVTHAPRGEIETGRFDGRDALYIRRGQAWLADLDLADMVIEYEFAATHASGFMGVNFRSGENATMEQFYVRPHQAGEPDATQYQPIINGSSAWQIHADANDAQATGLPAGEWIPVRIVVMGDRADFFVGDMETPLIHVPDLRIDGARGSAGLFMSDRPWMPDTGAWFSRISIRDAGDGDRIIGTPRDTQALPDGLVTNWQISPPFNEDMIAGAFDLPAIDDARATLAVESNGVANLARLSGIADGNNTVAAEITLHSDQAAERLMRFGYSDRIRLFVNGDLVFDGNAGWRARDHRHLGTIGFNDAIALELREGENRITAVVSESFGGWGIAAAIEDRAGLTIHP